MTLELCTTRRRRASALRAALLTLAACGAAEHRAAPQPAAAPPTRYRLAYQGTGELEGHLRAPGARRPFQIALDLSVDGAVRRLITTTWTDGDERDVEVIWVHGERAARAEGDGAAARLVPLDGEDAAWAHQLAHAADPAPPAERARAHPTFGDVRERAAPATPPGAAPGLADLGRVPAAAALSLAHHETDLAWTAELRRVAAPAAEPLALPASPAAAGAPRPAPAPIRIEQVRPGVFLAAVPATDTASLVVELADGLAVTETTLTVRDGEALVDALAARFPGKPIRHVFVSHYHPHYTGGLRAFFAAGATLHAPPRVAAYAREIAARSFALAPDRWARLAAAPRIEPFTGRFSLDTGAGRLEAIDLGAESDHTDEYTVIYLPAQATLFQGDLGWGARGGALRVGRRGASLERAITARGLTVATLIQGWPLMDGHQAISAEAWRAALAAPR